MIDKKRVGKAVQELLLALGEDPEREGLKETPQRVARMCEELLAGQSLCGKELVKCFEAGGYDDLVVIKNIEFHSVCEHHLMPFFGEVSIAYLPQENRLLGLSKVARIVDLFAHRLQVQERLTGEIANFFEEQVQARGVLVVAEARHLCMEMRGVHKSGSITKTMVVKGALESDENLQKRAMEMIGR